MNTFFNRYALGGLLLASVSALFMKSSFRRGTLGALLLISATTTPAAYNPGLVASDARWVIYADLNVLRESALGKELVTALAQAQTQATGGAIGLDVPRLLMTIGSITAYGTNLAADPNMIDGALVAQGTPDLRKITEGLLLQGTIAQPEVFSEITDLPFPAYGIGDSKAPADRQMKLIVAFPPEPIVLLGKSKAQLLKAREVFRGSAPSVARTAGSPFAKLTSVADGAYLFAATIVPSAPIFPQNATQARLLQLTSSVALAFGERGPDTFVRSELHASSEANAEKLSKILQGLTAMLSMAETSDKQLTEFLNSTLVKQEKDTVTLRLSYPTERLVQMSRALHNQVEAKPAVRRPQPLTIGKTLAEWGGSDASNASVSTELAWQTIENVSLLNGSVITVGRALNGSQNARIDRVEIVPAEGNGMPLVFRLEAMRGVSGRGSLWQLVFPGAPGVYTLKVAYVRDPEGKATFAASMNEPNAPKTEGSGKGPLVPQPKILK